MNAHSIKISGRALDRAGNRALQARIRRQKQGAKREAPRNAGPELLKALKGLFKHCVMVHKHWGENCNNQQADDAQAFARRAIALAEGRFICSISPSRPRKRS